MLVHKRSSKAVGQVYPIRINGVQTYRTRGGNGESYVDPEMRRYEVPTVRARQFDPNQVIPEYSPESDLLPTGAGLSDYFGETRTPEQVMIARENTEQLRRSIIDMEDARQVHERIDNAKLDLIRSSGFIGGPSPQAVGGLFGVPSQLSSSFPVARRQIAQDYIKLPLDKQEEVKVHVREYYRTHPKQGRKLEQIHPKPHVPGTPFE